MKTQRTRAVPIGTALVRLMISRPERRIATVVRSNPSRHREFRQLPHVRRLKAEHDVYFRHTGFNESLDDPSVRPILLDPNLPIAEPDVNRRATDAAFTGPANAQEQVVPMVVVENAGCLDAAFRSAASRGRQLVQ